LGLAAVLSGCCCWPRPCCCPCGPSPCGCSPCSSCCPGPCDCCTAGFPQVEGPVLGDAHAVPGPPGVPGVPVVPPGSPALMPQPMVPQLSTPPRLVPQPVAPQSQPEAYRP